MPILLNGMVQIRVGAEYMGKYLSTSICFYEYKYEYLFYQCSQVQVRVHFKVLEYKYEYISNHIYSNATTMQCEWGDHYNLCEVCYFIMVPIDNSC